MASDTQLLRDPQLSDSDENDGFAHIGRAADVNRAYVTGEAITALCGRRFVPTRDPEKFPLCPRCAAVMSQIKTGRSGAN